ncbi:MAG TPA: GDSL-type esterase/lipase family protein [Clostridium sp.]
MNFEDKVTRAKAMLGGGTGVPATNSITDAQLISTGIKSAVALNTNVIGSTALSTTAQTLTAAINEVNAKPSGTPTTNSITDAMLISTGVKATVATVIDPSTLSKAVSGLSVGAIIDDTDSSISYVGASWVAGVTTMTNHNQTYHQGNFANDYLQIAFTGVGISLYDSMSTTRGIMEIFVDGVSKGLFDRYAPASSTQLLLYSISNLAYGSHTIKVNVTGTKNASATDYKILFDFYRVITPTSLMGATNLRKVQTNLLANFYANLSRKINVKIVCQGDSLTYGQDTVSGDKVIATGTTDIGTAHTQSHVPISYPLQLQTNLNAVNGTTSIVVNKGFSGDWVANSLANWTNNENADCAIIMLGTNDSNLTAAWVPSDVRGNLDRFLNDMRTLIERYLNWGTPVILLTPPRYLAPEDLYTTAGEETEPFRNALYLLGNEYNCPVIDTETFMDGCNASYYSDGTHHNTKGYNYFSTRLLSIFIGNCNPFCFPKISNGDAIGVRPTRDNMSHNVSILTGSSSTGGEENVAGQGLFAYVTPNSASKIYYGFETLEDDLVLIPIHLLDVGANVVVSLDLGLEQGSVPLLSAVNQIAPPGTKPVSEITTSTSSASTQAYDGTISTLNPTMFIHITNKGVHNIRYKNIGTSGFSYFNGFVVMSYKDFITQYKTRAL